MASMADSAGRKSSTSTFLFSFFLSIIHEELGYTEHTVDR